MEQRRGVLEDKAVADVKEGKPVTLYGLKAACLNGLAGTVKSIERGRTPRAVGALDRQSINALACASDKYAALDGRDSYDLAGIPVGCCRGTPSTA